MISTTEKGDTFRDLVANLLSMAGYKIEVETLVRHKKIDLVASYLRLGRSYSVAIEAKNYKRPLNKGDLEVILASHLSLLEKHQVDEILVVSNRDITSAAAKAYLRETKALNHLTFQELMESLFDFRQFLETFELNHERSGLEKYYIPQTTNADLSLEAEVMKWISSDENQPVAVIASYGMGKTSLANHIAYRLAKRHRQDSTNRIPILIPLGTLAQEQSLTGLIGTVLTGGVPSVANYNYPTFAKLNQQGRFVILLDGFDEMKHMMTYADFISNFNSLNDLAVGDAKVILLGRPSAFLSEDERETVLRGTRSVGAIKLRQSPKIVYRELEISPFDENQVNEFVKRYMKHKIEQDGLAFSDDLLAKRFQEIDTLRNSGLLTRPVHTKMFVDLAIDSEDDLSNISRYDLYDYFIENLVEREVLKRGRGGLLKSGDRRQFASDLAWFLWTDSEVDQGGCQLEELPNSLFEPYCPIGTEAGAIRRELISGTFLERKEPDIYYFAHRSFQEFLVAEYIWSAVDDQVDPDLGLAEKLIRGALTREVYEFIIEKADEMTFRGLARAISRSSVELDLSLIDLLFSTDDFFKIASERSTRNFTEFDTLAIVYRGLTQGASDQNDQISKLVDELFRRTAQRPDSLLQAIYFIVKLSGLRGAVSPVIGRALVALVFTDSVVATRDGKRRSGGRYNRGRLDNVIEAVFQYEPGGEKIEDGTFVLNVGELLLRAEAVVSNKIRSDSVRLEEFESFSAPLNEFIQLTRSNLKDFIKEDLLAMATELQNVRKN